MKRVKIKDYPEAIKNYFGENYLIKNKISLAGGSINEVSLLIFTNREKLILKENRSNRVNLFNKEAYGLNLLSKTVQKNSENPLIIPTPYIYYERENYRYMLLEYIPPLTKKVIQNSQDKKGWKGLAKGLAYLHQERIFSPEDYKYGLEDENYLGDANQKNSFHDNWINFFQKNRLEFQIDKARQNGYLNSKLNLSLLSLVKELPSILEPNPFPSLLHGDLWSGNVLFREDLAPAIIDPAVYYGDSETDLALTELFGRLGEDFYKEYFSIKPKSINYKEKSQVYNLYHLLNHLNLFGLGYLSSIERSLKILGFV